MRRARLVVVVVVAVVGAVGGAVIPQVRPQQGPRRARRPHPGDDEGLGGREVVRRWALGAAVWWRGCVMMLGRRPAPASVRRRWPAPASVRRRWPARPGVVVVMLLLVRVLVRPARVLLLLVLLPGRPAAAPGRIEVAGPPSSSPAAWGPTVPAVAAAAAAGHEADGGREKKRK